MLPAPAIWFQAMPGCRAFNSPDKRRDASEITSRQRVTAYRYNSSRWKLSKVWPCTNRSARSMWRSISRRTPWSASEGIERIPHCRRAQMGLEGGAIDDVNRALKQADNVIPQSHVIENGDVRLGINVDDDVEVAVGTVLAARDRPEDSGVANAARTQVAFMAGEGSDGIPRVHAK